MFFSESSSLWASCRPISSAFCCMTSNARVFLSSMSWRFNRTMKTRRTRAGSRTDKPKKKICLRRLLFKRPEGRECIDSFYHFPLRSCHGIVKILFAKNLFEFLNQVLDNPDFHFPFKFGKSYLLPIGMKSEKFGPVFRLPYFLRNSALSRNTP